MREAVKKDFFTGSCWETYTHLCVEKVSCDTFFGIFKASKRHQANTAMCEECSCLATALHDAANHQQLKCHYRKLKLTEREATGIRINHRSRAQVIWSHLGKARRLHLLAAPNTQRFHWVHWVSETNFQLACFLWSFILLILYCTLPLSWWATKSESECVCEVSSAQEVNTHQRLSSLW